MFSERLKKLREDKGLSQAEFAKIIGVERTRYGKWENKGFEPPYETLVKIADYFDVSTDYLLCRTDYPHGYTTNHSKICIPLFVWVSGHSSFFTHPLNHPFTLKSTHYRVLFAAIFYTQRNKKAPRSHVPRGVLPIPSLPQLRPSCPPP